MYFPFISLLRVRCRILTYMYLKQYYIILKPLKKYLRRHRVIGSKLLLKSIALGFYEARLH